MQADKDMPIDQASWAVMRAISKLAYNVDPEQVTRAKNQLKAQILFSQDGPSGEFSDPVLSCLISFVHSYMDRGEGQGRWPFNFGCRDCRGYWSPDAGIRQAHPQG
jgi:hypothetical protein